MEVKYVELEKKANVLKKNIRDLSDENAHLENNLQYYIEATSVETPCEDSTVEGLYNEVGVYFSENVRKTLSETQRFHRSLVLNRKNFLQAEIEAIAHKISSNKSQIEKKRSQLKDVFKN